MVKIRKYANSIERFLHGEKGQRFFNFAYSIGAAIVIWGALFKILHLEGGNTLLCIGMGTEVAMFILTAFDRPPREYNWEDVFPELDHSQSGDDAQPSGAARLAGSGQAVVVAGGSGAAPAGGDYPSDREIPSGGIAGASGVVIAGVAPSADISGSVESLTEQIDQLKETSKSLNEAAGALLNVYRSVGGDSGEISDNSAGYASQMSDLNRNIAGLNTIYEIQLKSVSGQLETIDRVNRSMKDIRDMYEKSAHESSRYCEETEKMARYMKQLNAVYEKMITAMTINMQNPMMGGPSATNPFNENKD